MTRYERVAAALRHEPVDRVPSHHGFFDEASERKVLQPVWERTGSSDARQLQIAGLEHLDNDIAVAGSLRLRPVRTSLEPDGSERVEFENGSLWKVKHDPYFVEHLGLPVELRRDADDIALPDARDRTRYDRLVEDIGIYRSAGYFPIVRIHGFFSVIHYHVMPFDEFLMELLLEPERSKRIIQAYAGFILESAEQLLRRTRACLQFADDLGSSASLLISPELYREHFHPHHCELARLCHAYDSHCYMHSHGNINRIMDLLVDAGLDILDPVGPEDKMLLAELKREYGRRITFCGGISKNIGEMAEDELDGHIRAVVSAGAPGSGFILREEGGIPFTMSAAMVDHYLQASRRYRMEYGPLTAAKAGSAHA